MTTDLGHVSIFTVMKLNDISFLKLFSFLLIFILAQHTQAQDKSSSLKMPSSYLVAQLEGDDSYDPFADYSEYDSESEEEADIHFFRNGRLLTLAFAAGSRGFTDRAAHLYSGNVAYGLFITYFFDLNFALQFGFNVSDHSVLLRSPSTNVNAQGNLNLTHFGFNLKYFFNTKNVTRGLSEFNPYLLGGFSSFFKTMTVAQLEAPIKDTPLGLDIGGGFEVPMLRNKMFFGLQFVYHVVTFRDELMDLDYDVDNDGNVDRFGNQAGDPWELMGFIGINF